MHHRKLNLIFFHHESLLFTGIYQNNLPQFKVFHCLFVCLFTILFGFWFWLLVFCLFLLLMSFWFFTLSIFSVSASSASFCLFFYMILIHYKCFSWFISFMTSFLITIQPKHLVPHVYVNMTVCSQHTSHMSSFRDLQRDAYDHKML